MTARLARLSHRSVEDRLEPKRHNHGRMYRCKIVPYIGPTRYGEWFQTESEVCSAMKGMIRNIGERYYCEMKTITCPECNADEDAKVISKL